MIEGARKEGRTYITQYAADTDHYLHYMTHYDVVSFLGGAVIRARHGHSGVDLPESWMLV